MEHFVKKNYYASAMWYKRRICRSVEKYHIVYSVLHKNKIQKLVLFLNDVWLTLSRNVNGLTCVGVMKIAVHFVNFFLHYLKV